MNNYEMLNGVTLAYIGDSYYDLYIRKYLIDKNYTKVNDLHKLATSYVSATSQAKVVKHFMESGYLSDVELDIVKRGRNGKINHKRSNVDILTYKHSTSFEALIGFLYLRGDLERLEEVIIKAINIIENGDLNG
jgi:ribonuclease III family protein